MNLNTPKRILVVEDEPAIQDMIRMLLERVGYEVLPALNAAEAVQILRGKALPDVMLLDLMLPDVNGLELLRQMREKSAFENLPIIIVSALADPDQIRKGFDLGADRYVTKPAIATNLIGTVQDVIKSGRRKSG